MALEYSELVKKNFLHPKNLGEIKDADGIGKVGNPVCLLPEEKVHAGNSIVSINELKKNQEVLTHEGTMQKIILTSSRNYSGEMILLKNSLGNINLTPEHLVYALKIPGGSRFKRNKGKKQIVSSWYHANDLNRGDIILYPILKGERNVDYLEINIPKLKYDFKSKEVPNKIPMDRDLLRLFGYFLSEGNIQEKPSKNFISFTLNIKEKEIIEDIKEICKRLFRLDVKIKEIPERKTAIVYLYNAKISRWFKELFGNGAKNKVLPEFTINLPLGKQKHLIYGLWKGDGYVNLNRNGPRAGFVTISYQLVQQIKILLLRQGIVPSIYLDKGRVIGGVNHKDAYRIHIGQRDSLIKMSKILNLEYQPRSYPSISSWFDKDYLYTPITKIEKAKYSGRVYNLEVENAHSYAHESFCVHNCGDVMWVYIKVGNKKGKDFIKDIKFKTFGCAAAIATSSMVTQLAKGKTLEEAGKITRNDVAMSLNGLPPIKMHCSNLADEALREAIKDYENKKGKGGKNKKIVKK